MLGWGYISLLPPSLGAKGLDKYHWISCGSCASVICNKIGGQGGNPYSITMTLCFIFDDTAETVVMTTHPVV